MHTIFVCLVFALAALPVAKNCTIDIARVNDLISLTSEEIFPRSNQLLSHLVHPRVNMMHDDLVQIRQSFENVDYEETYLPKSIVNPLFTCPDAEEIAPCVCAKEERVTMDCSAAETFDEIKSVLQTASVTYTSYEKFVFCPESAENTGDIPSALFGKFTFESVYICSSTAETMDDGAFEGSEDTLVSVIFDTNTHLEIVSHDWFSNYVNLNIYVVGGSIMPTIPKFGNAPNLTYVQITLSQVTSIESNAFANLQSLAALDLANNYLSHISEDMMMISSVFLSVYFDANDLVEMAAFCDAQPFLLELQHNSLTSFDQTIYEPILLESINCPFTSYVSVTDNPIDCSEMTWLQLNPLYSSHVKSNC